MKQSRFLVGFITLLIKMRIVYLLICLTLLPNFVLGAEVKMSKSGICHDEDSSWYKRTKNYKPFMDMRSCLAEGRAYSGYDQNPERKPLLPATIGDGIPEYDRKLYGGWIDEDADCQNTRQEMLSRLSTQNVIWNEKGCTVRRGRWNDPYTNKVFTNASDLDIDHLVPLAYAHIHGAAFWPSDRRIEFGNDLRNLFAVQASVNRQKGAKGPTEWLPPNEKFRCQYLLRFDRIMKIYGLNYSASEGAEVRALRINYCGR